MHVESSAEEVLLTERSDLDFDEELLAEGVALGPVEAKVDLPHRSVAILGLEVGRDLDGDV